MIFDIMKKVEDKIPLSKSDAISLLETDNKSPEFYQLLSKANEMSRSQYKNKGYVFVQIGINSSSCSGNCKFCSLAKDSFAMNVNYEKSADEIISQVQSDSLDKVDSIFLMTTEDYNKEKFLTMGAAVKEILPSHINLVANIGDFDISYAKQLKEVGFSAAYHIVRLREGVDTDISIETRIKTLDAIRAVDLDLFYCIEPIGEEHTYDEIADEMIRARDYDVNVMAVMGRVGIVGTPYENTLELAEIELTKIVAVTRIVTNPSKSMNIHEPKKMALLAGVNQLYAEIGMNPRDSKKNTEENRGKSISEIVKTLGDGEYTVYSEK